MLSDREKRNQRASIVRDFFTHIEHETEREYLTMNDDTLNRMYQDLISGIFGKLTKNDEDLVCLVAPYKNGYDDFIFERV